MRKIISKIAGTLLGLSLALGVGGFFHGHSSSEVKAASGDKYDFSTAAAISGTSDDGYWSFAADKVSGTQNPQYNSGSSELRIYVNNYIEFTGVTGLTFLSASISEKANQGGSSGNKAYPEGWAVDNGTISELVKDGNTNTASVTGINASSFRITVSGAKGNVGFKSITMTYSYSGGEVTTYTINYFNNGGSGSMASTTSAAPKVAECSFTAPVGSVFSSWNTSADGKGDTYEVGTTVSENINLYAIWAEASGYKLVTDASKLVEGTQFILLHESDAKAAGTLTSNVFYLCEASIDGDTAYSDKATVFTLGGSSGAWTIAFDGKYLGKTLSTGTSFDTSTSLTDGYYWSIAIADGKATIKTEQSGTRAISYNHNNGTNSRFGPYTPSETYTLPRIYAQIPEQKTIGDTRLTTTNGSISAGVGAANWSISGFTFEIQYEGESSWNTVNPTYTVTETVPASYDAVGDYPVHFKVTYKGVDYHVGTEFTATVTDGMTPLSSFYDGTITVTTTESSQVYTYRGTVIGIEGNTYYIQQGNYGIMVYGGNKSYATGMKIGDLVKVTSTVILYSQVVESKTITLVDDKTCEILGDGNLPAAPIVTTAEAFNAANQSTRITFNGLSRNDTGTKITWVQEYEYGTGSNGAHGLAKVKDGNGTMLWLYISKYIDSTTGAAIVAKIETISVDDTFDLFQGVKALNTNNFSSIGGTEGVDYPAKGTPYLSVSSAEQITIHTPESDPIQDWIDLYMQMSNPDFDGDGTGACKDQSYYVNAKAALNVLEDSHPGSKASFQSESKYSDAYDRYMAWAAACGDTAPFTGSTIVQSGVPSYESPNNSNASTIIIVVVALTSITSIGVLLVIKRKRSLVK